MNDMPDSTESPQTSVPGGAVDDFGGGQDQGHGTTEQLIRDMMAELRETRTVLELKLSSLETRFSGLEIRLIDVESKMATKAEMDRWTERVELLDIRAQAALHRGSPGFGSVGPAYSIESYATAAPRDEIRRRRNFL